MSRFSGSQGKGAMRSFRQIKQVEAEARNALTLPARRRSFRRGPSRVRGVSAA